MIIRQRGDGLVLIEQNEHGRLAGELARAWGNGRFAAPTPLESVVTACARHDEGWRAGDAEPLFNAAEARPLHFTEIGLADHIALYREGVQTVAALDAYAGLMAGMHWTGLYNGRWGLPPRPRESAEQNPREDELRDAVVVEEERRWAAVKRTLIDHRERRAVWEAWLWHNYELLQAIDLLSLYVGIGPHDKPPAQSARADVSAPEAQSARADVSAPPAQSARAGVPAPEAQASGALTGSLGKLDAAPGEREIPAPTSPTQPTVTLRLRVGPQPGVVSISPYPFATDRLTLRLAGREIPARRYADSRDAQVALAAATPVEIACTFVGRNR